MRSSEIAAWHAATAACLVVIWAIAHRKARSTWIGAFLTIALLLAVLVTGRRKTLGMILLFLVVFSFLLFRWRRGATKLARVLFAIGLIGGSLALLRSGEGLEARWDPYFERSYSVVADAPERLWQMTYLTLRNVIRRNGFFGAGAGTGALGRNIRWRHQPRGGGAEAARPITLSSTAGFVLAMAGFAIPSTGAWPGCCPRRLRRGAFPGFVSPLPVTASPSDCPPDSRRSFVRLPWASSRSALAYPQIVMRERQAMVRAAGALDTRLRSKREAAPGEAVTSPRTRSVPGTLVFRAGCSGRPRPDGRLRLLPPATSRWPLAAFQWICRCSVLPLVQLPSALARPRLDRFWIGAGVCAPSPNESVLMLC
jgi:hypothetical protein